MADDKLKKLRKAAKKLNKQTSREDHKRPLTHEQEQYKIDTDQSVTDEEEEKSGE